MQAFFIKCFSFKMHQEQIRCAPEYKTKKPALGCRLVSIDSLIY